MLQIANSQLSLGGFTLNLNYKGLPVISRKALLFSHWCINTSAYQSIDLSLHQLTEIIPRIVILKRTGRDQQKGFFIPVQKEEFPGFHQAGKIIPG